jgi:PUA domain protein
MISSPIYHRNGDRTIEWNNEIISLFSALISFKIISLFDFNLLYLKLLIFLTIMFKKFNEKESVTSVTQLRNTDVKRLKQRLQQDFPHIESVLDEILPKKDTPKLVKCQDHIELIADSSGQPLFFRFRDSPSYIPLLRLLHKYPFILRPQQVDKGAIRFVLSGANIMCPGLTSPGAKLCDAPKDSICAVMAEGKEHALAIGLLKMATQDIQQINKGIGIETLHYLNDGLWTVKQGFK